MLTRIFSLVFSVLVALCLVACPEEKAETTPTSKAADEPAVAEDKPAAAAADKGEAKEEGDKNEAEEEEEEGW